MVASVTGTRSATAAAAKDPVRRLFAEHCQKCHSGPKYKGDFAIEHLSDDMSDRRSLEQWLTVLEQLKTGEMPPEEKPRPPAADLEAAIAWLNERTQPAVARRAAEGRVVLRRLNRAEYANTVRDLLGVEVDLTDLLPPDTSTSGFDNSAETLHTSSFLLRSYLDAADRVLDEAIANKPRPYQIKKRFDIKDEKSVKPTGSVYRHTDDGVAIFSSWVSANVRVTMWNFRSHVRGKYRFRISGLRFPEPGQAHQFSCHRGHAQGGDGGAFDRLFRRAGRPADGDRIHGATGAGKPDSHHRGRAASASA